MTRHAETPWTVTTDPTETRCKAIKAQFEYEPREFASVWVAREVSDANGAFIVRAVNAHDELLAACKVGAELAEGNLIGYPAGVTNDAELVAWFRRIIAKAEKL